MPCYAYFKNNREAKEVLKNFSPYVEGLFNDHTFLIRKTIAIWLLQENE